MAKYIVGGCFLWIISTFYLLVTWNWSPDSFLSWLALAVFVLGLVGGLVIAVVAIVAGVWTGHQEKKQWE